MSNALDVTNTRTLEEELQGLIQYARTACSTNGDLSSECAVAWDAVEEIQAAVADRRYQHTQTEFERYCADHPDASECRIYDV